MYFSPPFGGEKALYVHDGPGGGLFSFFLLLLACVFFILPPNTSWLRVFFPRYLQERLKQLHEEVNLLKSNIAKYKVENRDDAGNDSLLDI